MPETPEPTHTPCPICKRPVNIKNRENPKETHYPFCTERCKLVDLGRWLDAKYQIPVVEEDESDAEID